MLVFLSYQEMEETAVCRPLFLNKEKKNVWVSRCPRLAVRTATFPRPPTALGWDTRQLVHSSSRLGRSPWQPWAEGGSGRPGGWDKGDMKFPILPHPIRKQVEREGEEVEGGCLRKGCVCGRGWWSGGGSDGDVEPIQQHCAAAPVDSGEGEERDSPE